MSTDESFPLAHFLDAIGCPPGLERRDLSSVEDVRDASAAIGAWACNGPIGRSTGDDVHEYVTEGRRLQYEQALARGDAWAVALSKTGGFSTCGELCHAVAFLLGCRALWVNRTEHLGWKSTVNISNLRGSGLRTDHKAHSLERPPRGAIVEILGPEHVEIVESWDEEKGEGIFWAFGQPYGKRVRRQITIVRGLVFLSSAIGRRQLSWWIDVATLPRTEPAMVPVDA